MWKTVKLGDICEIKTGKKDVNEGSANGMYPFFTCAKDHTYSDVYSFDCEAILIAGNGAVGQTSYYKGKFEAYQRTYVLSDFHTILPKLLLFILEGTLMAHLSSRVLGNTIPYIKKGMLENFEFPLPPLAEQQRIVEKLDRAFEEIDRAIEATENSLLSLASFQETRVKDYFVNNITRAPVLSLSQVAEYFNGLTYSPKDVSENGTIVLRSSNIQNGQMKYDDIVRVDKKIKEKLIVRDSDILVCSRNGSKALIGKSAMIGDAEEIMTFGTFMMIIRSKYNNYLQWFFKSSLFRSQIVQGENTMINQITRYMLDKVTLPFPSEDTQRKIASELSQIDAQIRELTEIYCSKKNCLNSLKSAILAQELKGPES